MSVCEKSCDWTTFRKPHEEDFARSPLIDRRDSKRRVADLGGNLSLANDG